MKNKVVLAIVCLVTILFGWKVYYMRTSPQPQNINLPMPTLTLNADPHKMEDQYSMFLVGQIHRSLFRYTSDGSIINDLVASSFFDDETHTLHLKIKESTFSDLSRITNIHVIASLKRLFLLHASIAADLNYLNGYDEALAGNIQALDINPGPSDLDIILGLKYRTDLVFKHLALPDLAILKLLNPTDSLPPTDLVSGTYKITAWTTREILLSAWRENMNGRQPAEVRLLAIKPAGIFAAAKAGIIDSTELFSLNDESRKTLIEDGWKEVVSNQSYENFLLLNPNLLNKQLRETILNYIYSADFQSFLIKHSLEPAYGLIPNNLPGAIKQKQETNQNEFKIHGTSKLKISFLETNSQHQLILGKLKSALSKIGVEIIEEALDIDSFYKLLFSKKAAAILAGKSLDYPDGYANLSYFRTDIENNFLFMENSTQNSIVILESTSISLYRRKS